MMCVMTYMVDTFTLYAASALAANTVTRSIGAALLPLCGLRICDVLGLGWGNSLLGFIAILAQPASLLILRYGASLRTQFSVAKL
jgi:hypothetical protein